MILIVFGGLYMGIGAALYPIAVALTNDLMDTPEITPASTALLLSYGIGSCIGPVASALMMELVGPRGLFLTGTLMLGGLIGFMTLGGGRTQSPVSQQQREDFVTTTPEASLGLAELDPRNPGRKGYNEKNTEIQHRVRHRSCPSGRVWGATSPAEPENRQHNDR